MTVEERGTKMEKDETYLEAPARPLPGEPPSAPSEAPDPVPQEQGVDPEMEDFALRWKAVKVVAAAMRHGQPHDGSDLDLAVDEDAKAIVAALRDANLLRSETPEGLTREELTALNFALAHHDNPCIADRRMPHYESGRAKIRSLLRSQGGSE